MKFVRSLALTGVATVAIVSMASAEQIIAADDGGVITGHVSASGVTRISFIGDEAASVQLSQGGEGPGFSIAHEPTTGDLYLTLSREPGRGEAIGAASFFVTTRAGFTYQVELAAKDTPSTQIAIRNDALQIQRARQTASSEPQIDRLVGLTRAMWNGALMEGYQVRRPLRRENAAGSLRMTPISVYEGETLTGRVIEIRNPTPGEIEVSEDVFLAPGVLSVVIKGPRRLGPNERTAVLIIDGGDAS